MTEAFDEGFVEARLTGPQADLVWGTMQLASCTVEEALGYLLAIARAEVASGDWDGSTARETGAQGVEVRQTNLHLFTKFKQGDLVVLRNEAGVVLVGQIKEINAQWTKLTLTRGSIQRLGDRDKQLNGNASGEYTARTQSLQDL